MQVFVVVNNGIGWQFFCLCFCFLEPYPYSGEPVLSGQLVLSRNFLYSKTMELLPNSTKASSVSFFLPLHLPTGIFEITKFQLFCLLDKSFCKCWQISVISQQLTVEIIHTQRLASGALCTLKCAWGMYFIIIIIITIAITVIVTVKKSQ